MSTKATPWERLSELLGANSKNFLGTGLTMTEFLNLGHAEKLAAAWTLQPREEQRRRLNAVIALSVELAKIREQSNFATRLGELAIEAVIEGDWKMVAEWAEHFQFAEDRQVGDDSVVSGTVARWAVFRELLLQAHRAEDGATA